MFTSVLAGLGLGFSLIVAIGAQNLFVLRQGMRREHVLAVALICAVSDMALTALGVSGLGFALRAVPWLTELFRWVGALSLLVYAAMAAWRAVRPSGGALVADTSTVELAPGPPAPAPADAGGTRTATALATRTTDAAPASRLIPVVLMCLALTWLNPHVYLDTVLLLGSIANTHGDTRWAFAAGAMIASITWFFGLAYGARHLGRLLATPRAWRILDGIIAVVIVAVAINLVLGA